MEQNIPKMSDLDPQYWSSGLSAQLMYLKVSKLVDELTEKYNSEYLKSLKAKIAELGIALSTEQMTTNVDLKNSSDQTEYKDFFDYIYKQLLTIKNSLQEEGVEPDMSKAWASEIQAQIKAMKSSRLKELNKSKYTYLYKDAPSREISQDKNLIASQMKVIWEPAAPNQIYDYYIKLSSKNKLKAEYNITINSITVLATAGVVFSNTYAQIKINEIGGIEIYPKGYEKTVTIGMEYPFSDNGVFYIVTNGKINDNDIAKTSSYITLEVALTKNNKDTIIIYPVYLEEKIHPSYPPSTVVSFENGVIFLPELSFPFSQERQILIDTSKRPDLICDFDTIALNEIPLGDTKYYFDIDRGVRGSYEGGTTISAKDGSSLAGLWFPPDGADKLYNFRAGRAIGMTSILMQSSIKSLNNSVFNAHPTLKTIYFSPDITSIPKQCCYHGVIKNIYFGGSEQSIGDKAFLQNDIKTIVFPSTLTYIGLRAFYQSRQTLSVTFTSDKQLHIHGDAFNYYSYTKQEQIEHGYSTSSPQGWMTLDFSQCTNAEWPELYLDWERAGNGEYYLFKYNDQSYFYNLKADEDGPEANTPVLASNLEALSWDTKDQHYYLPSQPKNKAYWYKPYRVRFMSGLGISKERVTIVRPSNWGAIPEGLTYNFDKSVGGEESPKIGETSLVQLIYDANMTDIDKRDWSYYEDRIRW